jgi:hypothetical protein
VVDVERVDTVVADVVGQPVESQAQPEEHVAGLLGPNIVPLKHVNELEHQPQDNAAVHVPQFESRLQVIAVLDVLDVGRAVVVDGGREQLNEYQVQPNEQVEGLLGASAVPKKHVAELMHQPQDDAAVQVLHEEY